MTIRCQEGSNFQASSPSSFHEYNNTLWKRYWGNLKTAILSETRKCLIEPVVHIAYLWCLESPYIVFHSSLTSCWIFSQWELVFALNHVKSTIGWTLMLCFFFLSIPPFIIFFFSFYLFIFFFRKLLHVAKIIRWNECSPAGICWKCVQLGNTSHRVAGSLKALFKMMKWKQRRHN